MLSHPPSSVSLRRPGLSRLPTKFLRLCVIAALLATVFAPAPPVRAASFVVNTTADNTTDDAFCTLREAMLAANNAPANSNCGAGSATDDTITFNAGSVVTITLGSALPNVVSGQGVLTIDGGGNVAVSGNDSVRVMRVDGDAHLNVQNLRLVNGRASGSLGAGLWNSGVVTITNSTFSGHNTPSGGGAALYNLGSMTIVSSTVSNNTTTGGGGGLYNDAGAVTITGSTFSSNTATGANGSGGGLYTFLGTVTINNSSFISNAIITAGSDFSTIVPGGGLYTTVSIVTINNSTFYNNYISITTGSDGGEAYGGGLYQWGGAVTTNNSTFINNSADYGGGFFIRSGSITTNNTIFTGNFGGSCEGGIPIAGNNNLADDATCIWGAGSGSLSNTNPLLGALTGSPAYFPLLDGSPAIDAGTNTGCPATSQNGVARPADGDGNGTATCDIGSYEKPPAFYSVFLPLLRK